MNLAIQPWILAVVATVVGAAAFFFAGFFFRARPRESQEAEPVAPVDADVSTLLELLADATRSEATTLLDQDGLVVVGAQASPHAQALAGSLASALHATMDHGLGGAPGVFELQLADGRHVRLSCAAVAGAVYAVATVGARAAPAPGLERRILAAIPRLAAA